MKLTKPCKEWTGTRLTSGYGLIRTVYGYAQTAHRDAWVRANGEIPPGMVVCHHCDNPPCYELEHLFLGTYKDNSQDMVKKLRYTPHQAMKTHCPKGHEYTEENTYIAIKRTRKERMCRQCGRDRARERYRSMNNIDPSKYRV